MISNKYPKIRNPLPPKYEIIYKQSYKDNRDGKGLANYLSQKMEEWGHKIVEEKFKDLANIKTLEIGAGNLNHLKYTKNHICYDVVEPADFFFKDSPYLKKVNNIYKDLGDINRSVKYDRILSIMVLEHVLDLPALIKSSKKLLAEKGIFQASIPCQGEFAFHLGWRLTTGISFFLKHGLDWGVIMNYEHVNTLDEIYEELKKEFKNVKLERSPLPFFLKKKHFSFYAYIEAYD